VDKAILTAAILGVLFAGCGPEGVTSEEVREMNDRESSALLACQVTKYGEKVGQKEAMDWAVEDSVKDIKDGGKVTPLQIEFIEEKGISCTREEMTDYYGAS